mmetsp:Transcript_56958/g.162268  ORF Transcript_56958/g.162268 Transcript_56958/m.162268 type:complete len:252 (+) Transcript_56958:634-1389(+)
MYTKDVALICVVLDWVRPQQVVDPRVRVVVVQRTTDSPDVVDLEIPLADAAVHAQDAVGDQAGDGHDVEGQVEELEQLGPKRPQPLVALVQEAVPLVHEAELVVAPHQPHLLGQQHLEREQQAYDLQLVLATIDEVAVEDEHRRIALVRAAESAEYEQQVPELAVDVAEDLAGRAGLHQRRLDGADLRGGPREEGQRVDVLLAEELHQEALLAPAGVERVAGLLVHELRQLPRLLHDGPGSASGAAQHQAS